MTAFSISFTTAEFDESNWARRIADHLGMRYERVVCTPDSLAAAVEKTLFHTEIPLWNPHAVAKAELSKWVRSRGVKACLTGEGGDELFAGHGGFRLLALREMWAKGGPARKESESLWRILSRQERRYQGLNWRGVPPWRSQNIPAWRFYPMGGVPIPLLERLFQPGVHPRSAASLLRDLEARCFPESELREMTPMNAARRVALDVLNGYNLSVFGDRPEMANSVEGRTPLLDREVFEYAARLPSSLLIDPPTLREKYVLYKSAEADLPAGWNRHKHPMLAPLWKTLAATRPGREWAAEYLSPRGFRRFGLFDSGTVSPLVRLWRLLPSGLALCRTLDVLIGMVLGFQMLQHLLIERSIPSAGGILIVDRSKRCLDQIVE
jgi:asparagine synthase (glutamine-hydrolysing)